MSRQRVSSHVARQLKRSPRYLCRFLARLSVSLAAALVLATVGGWCAGLSFAGWSQLSRRPDHRTRLSAGSDPLDKLRNIGGGQRGGMSSDAKSKGAGGAIGGAVGGAVLGGLLLGPFGALFGAQLGSDYGRQKASDTAAIKEMGLDQEMVQLAQTVGNELAVAVQIRDDEAAKQKDLEDRIPFLETEVKAKYDWAMEALESKDEELARTAIKAKQTLEKRLEESRSELAVVEQRCRTMDRNVDVLEDRATEVARLLERAQSARLRGDRIEAEGLTSEAAMMSMPPPRDPLMDKFDKLERGER
eukprot:TRINITY_DN102223_c0_g1_i1.p1 TRINITY_DN102223_c0_g1~~TRINITY_DN102223_c0_g1_i1.p1  ORF type:complete len:303 (-),score=76.59 TRINITY_DN102223_c0_g1_i1:7-915(-)